MKLSNTHASNLDVVGRIHVPTADVVDLLSQTIVDFAAELRILVEIGHMRLAEIYFDCIVALLEFLMLLLVLLSSLPARNGLINVPLLLFCLFELLQHIRTNGSHVEFSQHFLHLLHLQSQLFSFLSKSPDELVSFTFVYYCLVLNLLGLVCISKSSKGLVVVISGWGNGTDHEGFGVASQSILEDTGEARISVRDNHVFSLARGLIRKSRDDQAEDRQTFVDSGCFFESVSRGSRLAHFFGPSQIHQVDHRQFLSLLAPLYHSLFELNGNDGVSS